MKNELYDDREGYDEFLMENHTSINNADKKCKDVQNRLRLIQEINNDNTLSVKSKMMLIEVINNEKIKEKASMALAKYSTDSRFTLKGWANFLATLGSVYQIMVVVSAVIVILASVIAAPAAAIAGGAGAGAVVAGGAAASAVAVSINSVIYIALGEIWKRIFQAIGKCKGYKEDGNIRAYEQCMQKWLTKGESILMKLRSKCSKERDPKRRKECETEIDAKLKILKQRRENLKKEDS